MENMITEYKTVKVNGLSVFYREIGDQTKPKACIASWLTLFLLTSTRNLMPTLAASHFHVVAPDYPGFGNCECPSPDDFNYTFDGLSVTTWNERYGQRGVGAPSPGRHHRASSRGPADGGDRPLRRPAVPDEASAWRGALAQRSRGRRSSSLETTHCAEPGRHHVPATWDLAARGAAGELVRPGAGLERRPHRVRAAVHAFGRRARCGSSVPESRCRPPGDSPVAPKCERQQRGPRTACAAWRAPSAVWTLPPYDPTLGMTAPRSARVSLVHAHGSPYVTIGVYVFLAGVGAADPGAPRDRPRHVVGDSPSCLAYIPSCV